MRGWGSKSDVSRTQMFLELNGKVRAYCMSIEATRTDVIRNLHVHYCLVDKARISWLFVTVLVVRARVLSGQLPSDGKMVIGT